MTEWSDFELRTNSSVEGVAMKKLPPPALSPLTLLELSQYDDCVHFHECFAFDSKKKGLAVS